MNLEELKKIALSTRSQSFVSIEAWELLGLVEIVEAALAVEKKFMAIEDGFYAGLVPPEFGDVSLAMRKLSKLTSGGEG